MDRCEDIFPNWITARIILTEWVNGFAGWRACFDRGALMVGPAMPFDFIMFPEEDRKKVKTIFYEVAGRYFPKRETEEMLHLPMNTHALMRAESAVRSYEHFVVGAGGDWFKDALAKALGIYPFLPEMTVTFSVDR